MGADDDAAKPVASADVRFNWISDRTCSSLKIKEDVFQKLLASESKCVRRTVPGSQSACEHVSSVGDHGVV